VSTPVQITRLGGLFAQNHRSRSGKVAIAFCFDVSFPFFCGLKI
jgi:hypothetical protein